MRTKVQIHPYLKPDLAKRLNGYASRRHVTVSAVIEAALTAYLEGQINDRDLIIGRLDRLARGQRRLDQDIEIVRESFALWVQLWFAHTPRIPDSEHAAARTQAAGRFRDFVDKVAKTLASGRTYREKLVPPESTAAAADESEDTDVTANTAGSTTE